MSHIDSDNRYRRFLELMGAAIPADRIIGDPLRTLAYGTDASFYRLIPRVVVKAENEGEVVSVLKAAGTLGLPVTFRAAGTSLSGQAVSDSILLIAGNSWTSYSALDNGARIRLQPGVIGAQANRYLAPFGRKIGPDPASINAAMIGGIAANNASGMCCGTAQNSYRTVVEHAHKASALMIFPNIESACRAVYSLRQTPVQAVELMDRTALRSVESKKGMPEYLKELPGDATALLVETRAAAAEELHRNVTAVLEALDAELPGTLHESCGWEEHAGFAPTECAATVLPIRFTDAAEEYTRLWDIRKGLFPAVGAVRPVGTTVIIEDVAFPLEHLAAATLELQQLFHRYHYDEAIIFGHALEGNLHFVFTQDFSDLKHVERYRRFMDDICHMVVERYTGEHTKFLRGLQAASAGKQKAAHWIAANYRLTAGVLRAGLGMAQWTRHRVGTRAMQKISGVVRALSGKHLPTWNPYMPQAVQGPRWRPADQGKKRKSCTFPPASIR